MALSNWDTFAMNEKGEPCKGKFVSPLGVEVEIYKNWIYVSDNIAWQEGGGHNKPVVMEIYDSQLHYKDVSIVSKFENGTVYVVAWSGWSHKGNMKGIVGIGKYGFIGDKYVGTTKEDLEALHEFLYNIECYSYSIPDEFKYMDFSKGKRFNQGDMFFHDEIGVDKQCSEVGKADEPILSQVFKNTKNVKNEEK